MTRRDLIGNLLFVVAGILLSLAAWLVALPLGLAVAGLSCGVLAYAVSRTA